MKETGVVRRLDELGRVVIPKEIRKRLKIKNGDMVDIFTKDEFIILQKYHPLKQDLLPIKSILEAVSKQMNIGLLIFDDSSVIHSTIKDIKTGEVVSHDFLKRINNFLDKELSSKLDIEVIPGYKFDKDLYIEKILVNYETYGYILVVDDMITKKHKEAIELVNEYMKHFLQT